MQPGRPSATAELVAQGTVLLSRDPLLKSLIPGGADEVAISCLRQSAPAKLMLTRLASTAPLRGFARALERLVLPGLLLHHALRKRFIEDAARAFLQRHHAQLVVLGAGFDALAVRIAASRPTIACLELDHPATQDRKRRALSQPLLPNLELVPVDLGTTPLGEALGGARSLVAGRPTFFVLEGVTMYLTEELVARTLEDAAAQGGPQMQIAWTFMTPSEDGRIAFRRSRRGWVDAWLASRGEPFTWGISRERLPSFLEPRGLRVVDIADGPVLRSRYLSAAQARRPLAEGEVVCLCERA